MRIAIVTESFPPAVDGVAHSVVRVAEHLVGRGHAVMVVAPAPSSATRAVSGVHPYPVVRVPSLPVPRYRSFRLGLPLPRLGDALVEHAPDVVHLASPFLLGARGVTLAGQLNLPSVAVFQTDVAGYARAYLSRLGAAGTSGRRGMGPGRDLGEAAAWRWLRTIHNGADRTLAWPGSCPTATRWPRCSPPPTWRSPPARWRRSGWPRWRRCASLLGRPEAGRRAAARARAEQYGWPAAVAGFLRAHRARM